MKIYLYDDNFQFIKQTYAILDLEQSRQQGKPVYSLPDKCTEIEPPQVKPNETLFFINGEWVIKKDYRGKKFFDPATNRTVVIDALGDIPKNYIDLSSKRLINYINSVPFEKLYNNIKSKIDNNTKIKLDEKVLIGKYYFNNHKINIYLQLFNEATNKIKNLNKEITNIEDNIKKESDIEKINEMKLQQLDKYNEIDLIKIKASVENKRNKTVEVEFNYQDFKDIINKLNSLINSIKQEQKNNLIKINKLSKYELVLFEQRLIQEELNYGAAETKKDTKANS